MADKDMADRLTMTRLVKGRAPGREFDIEFWQKLGPTKIFEAAWDLVVTAAAVRGIGEDQLRLQRSVTNFQRRGSSVPDRGRLCSDGPHGAALHEGPGHLD